MPSETRQILLTKQELLQALEAFRRSEPDALPPGRLVDCRIDPQHGLDVLVESAFDPPQQPLKRRLSRTTTVRVLVGFCIEQRIPLPRAGAKMLAVEGDRLGLNITLPASPGGGRPRQAEKNQGQRTDLTSAQSEQKSGF